MIIHDISVSIYPGMVVWPERSDVSVHRILDVEQGDAATDSEISLGVHTGTHVDAPIHFVQGGTGVDALALDALYGPALVCHEFEANALTAEVFERLKIPNGVERLLVRTRNSDLWAQDVRTFAPDYVAVTADGARWLVEHKIRVIGVDYLSVASFNDLHTPHDILLRAGVIPVEGLNLSGIAAGNYTFCCLPLKLVGADGAPARAILIEDR